MHIVQLYKLKNATCTVTSMGDEDNNTTTDITTGSGFFIRKSNKYYVITCAHVLQGQLNQNLNATYKIYIDVQNVNKTNIHRQILCKLIGFDITADIAVLEPISYELNQQDGFTLKNHPYLTFGTSSTTLIGEECVIIGNPLGIDPFSISNGIVRDNKFVFNHPIESMLISASAWSGNSGSPIINRLGKVIGMVGYSIDNASTMIGGPTQFMMEEIINRIISSNSNYITKGYLGIKTFSPITDAEMANLRVQNQQFLNGNNDILKGIVVKSTDQNMMSQIPLLVNDIITEIHNPITNKSLILGNLTNQYHFSRMTWFMQPGQQVTLKIVRPSTNTIFSTSVTLLQYPENVFFPNNLSIDINNTNYKINTNVKSMKIKKNIV